MATVSLGTKIICVELRMSYDEADALKTLLGNMSTRDEIDVILQDHICGLPIPHPLDDESKARKMANHLYDLWKELHKEM